MLLMAVGTVANSKVASEEASSSSTPRSSLGLTPPEMPSTIGTSLEDDVGTVLFHLIAVARDISARGALKYWDLHEEVDITVTSTGMPSIWSLPLPMWLP